MPRLIILFIPLLCSGCVSRALNEAARNITLNTPEPVKVEMKVTMDIYRHDAPDAPSEATPGAPVAVDAPDSEDAAKKRKFNRQEEIQTAKNSRLVAETHRGTLFLREKPAGNWGQYVQKLIDDENADRMFLMRTEAERTRRQLNEIQKERWEANVKAALTGEWIEANDEAKPGSFKLITKP